MRLIDADEYLNKMCNNCELRIERLCKTPSDEKGCFANEINNIPTVEAEPVKHGHWETIKNAYGEIEGFIHAECGRTSNSKDNYCPNCGAKMDEEYSKKD